MTHKEAHKKLYGYDDPYFDIEDGSLRSEMIKTYLNGIKAGFDFCDILKTMIRERFNQINRILEW